MAGRVLAKVIPFADNSAIETAPAPGARCSCRRGRPHRRLPGGDPQLVQNAFGTGTGGFVGRAFIVIGGYGWLLIGLAGIVFWLADQF